MCLELTRHWSKIQQKQATLWGTESAADVIFPEDRLSTLLSGANKRFELKFGLCEIREIHSDFWSSRSCNRTGTACFISEAVGVNLSSNCNQDAKGDPERLLCRPQDEIGGQQTMETWKETTRKKFPSPFKFATEQKAKESLKKPWCASVFHSINNYNWSHSCFMINVLKRNLTFRCSK